MNKGMKGWPKPPVFGTTQLFSTVAQSIANGSSFVAVTFGSVTIGKFANQLRNGIVVPVDGLYTLAAIGGYAANATGQRDVEFLITRPHGPTVTAGRGTFPGDTTFDTYMMALTEYVLRTGWVVSLQTRQDSGGALNLNASAYLSVSLVHRIGATTRQ